jgi:hypothetical protein
VSKLILRHSGFDGGLSEWLNLGHIQPTTVFISLVNDQRQGKFHGSKER